MYLSNVSCNLCGDCRKRDVCKYIEEVRKAELNFSGSVNLPECLVASLQCKYKDYIYDKATIRVTYDSVHASTLPINTVTKAEDVCCTLTDTNTKETF